MHKKHPEDIELSLILLRSKCPRHDKLDGQKRVEREVHPSWKEMQRNTAIPSSSA